MKILYNCLVFLVLAFVCFITHQGLIDAGVGILNADFAVYPLTIEWIRQGNWYPFQQHYEYGGIILSLFRIPWSWVYEAILQTPDAFLRAHISFFHLVIPTVLSFCFYLLARSYASFLASFFTAIVCAIGFNAWTINAGIEFYNSYLITGALLLALRAPYENPFIEMSKKKLFLASLIAGLAYYNCRASAVYLVAFFLPLSWFIKTVKDLFKPGSALEKWVLRIGLFLLGLFVYLEVFGPNLGKAFDKTIKVHAEPNLRFAVILFAFLWFKRNYGCLVKEHFKKAIVVGAGVFIGMLPEIFFWLSQGKLPPLTGGRTYSFADSFRALGRVPEAINAIFGSTGQSVFRNASLLLVVASVVVLIVVALRDRTKKPGLSAVGFAGVLSVLAYARVLTYDFAPPRYLLPLFPTIIVGFALLIDWARSRNRVVVTGVFILLLLHSYDQLLFRKHMTDDIINHGFPQNALEVVKRFQAEGVSVVLSDNYWYGNQYSVISRMNPVFVPVGSPFILPDIAAKAGTEKRAGIILVGDPLLGGAPPENKKDSVVLDGRNWRLRFLGDVGNISLYIGDTD